MHTVVEIQLSFWICITYFFFIWLFYDE